MFNTLKPKGEFGRNVITLMTGTVAAQAIPIAASPILTRLYTPDDFGLFAMYTAIVGTFSVVVTGRYELAVMHPDKDDDAKRLIVVALLVSSIVCLILAVVTYFYTREITRLLRIPEAGAWFYLVPLTLLMTGWYQTYNYWLNRKKNYRGMSRNKVVQTGSLTAVQIAAGFLKAGGEGLLIGHMTGWFLSLYSLARPVKFGKESFDAKSIKNAAAKYREYPLIQAPSSFLNTATSQAPVFFITGVYLSATTGFYNLTVKVLTAPAAVISKSIGQVYFQRMTEIAQTSPDRLVPEFLQTAKKLLAIAFFIFMPFGFFGKELFSVVFGAAWTQAGSYAQLLAPAVAVKFVVSPLSTVFLAIHKINLSSYWQILYAITSLVILSWASQFDITGFLTIYSIHECGLYAIYFFMMLSGAKSFSNRVMTLGE